MKIIGLDPGTATVGFAICEKQRGRLTALDYGVITTPKGLAAEKRLLMIAEDLDQILTEHQPELAIVEKLFFAKNQTTAMAVSQARGVLLLVLARHGVSVRELSPPQVKQAVTGSGNAKKPQVQRMVAKLYGLAEIPKPDDAADALALVYAGC
jgi:crossover junction endodeoxyribonuclease RuvC